MKKWKNEWQLEMTEQIFIAIDFWPNITLQNQSNMNGMSKMPVSTNEKSGHSKNDKSHVKNLNISSEKL